MDRRSKTVIDYYQRVGERLRQSKNSSQLTAKEVSIKFEALFGEKLGRSALTRILKGEQSAYLHHVVGLARIFEVSLEDMCSIADGIGEGLDSGTKSYQRDRQIEFIKQLISGLDLDEVIRRLLQDNTKKPPSESEGG